MSDSTHELIFFAVSTNPECCGTCTHMTTGRYAGFRRKDHGKVACEVHRCLLPGNLEAVRCTRWRQERRETFQVQRYQELVEQNRKNS